MLLLSLPSKPSFQELQFNTKLVFWYFVDVISLSKTMKQKNGVRIFFSFCIFLVINIFVYHSLSQKQ